QLFYLRVSTTSHFFFSNHTPTTHLYTLSLHDALPIFPRNRHGDDVRVRVGVHDRHHGNAELVRLVDRDALLLRVHHEQRPRQAADRKSTRLNSSHVAISYAVFCLKKKKGKTSSAR